MTRPGDVFFPRWDADGPAAVDITIRDPLAPSNPLGGVGALEKWRETQEREKHRKYDSGCRSLGYGFIALVMDIFGGMAPEGRAFFTTLVKSLTGGKAGWQRREAEASAWQEVGFALARSLGRQLAWHSHLAPSEEREGATPSCHAPYCQ